MKNILQNPLPKGDNESSEQLSDLSRNTQHERSKEKFKPSSARQPGLLTQNTCTWYSLMTGSLLEFLLPVGPARSLPAEGERRQSRHTGLGSFRLGAGSDTGLYSDLALLPAHGPHPAELLINIAPVRPPSPATSERQSKETTGRNQASRALRAE